MDKSGIDLDVVKRAYRRHAHYYDTVFGVTLAPGRRIAVERINRMNGVRLLEVGVGTGLTLPMYDRDKRVTGIDISTEMLDQARRRVDRGRLPHVEALLEMDAEKMDFDDDSFDVVVAPYVISGVANPDRFLQEAQRVCRAEGDIVLVNHFAKPNGVRGGVERFLVHFADMFGWRPDLQLEPLLDGSSIEVIEWVDTGLLGLLSVVHCRNRKPAAAEAAMAVPDDDSEMLNESKAVG